MQNALLSVENWKEAAAVPSALGLNPSSAALLNAFVSGPVARIVPETFARFILDSGLNIGKSVTLAV